MAKRWERALVTGASSGIGEAIARRLAAEGTDLVLVARSEDRLVALAGELATAHGVSVEVLAADLADMGQLAEIEQRVAEREAAVDLLVNNAGFGVSGDFAGHLVEDVEGEILVNVLALARLCHAALGRMVDEGRGAILNVSSTASFQPMPGSADYAATKAYVTSLSQALHEEALGAGVAVSALCPGLTRTEFQQRGGFVIEVPGLLWQSADDVARAGLDGVAANHAVVIPGVHNAATAHFVRLLPLGVARRMAAVVGRRLG